jgi:hypothetical protein
MPLRRYAQEMVSGTQAMVSSSWARGGTRDVYQDYGALTLRITMAALFGTDTAAPQAQAIVAAIEKAFDFFARRGGSAFALPEWVPTWDNLEFGAAVQQLDRVGGGMAGRQALHACAPCLHVACVIEATHAEGMCSAIHRTMHSCTAAHAPAAEGLGRAACRRQRAQPHLSTPLHPAGGVWPHRSAPAAGGQRGPGGPAAGATGVT